MISNSSLEPGNQLGFRESTIILEWIFCVYVQLCFFSNIQCYLYFHFHYGFLCMFFKISWTLSLMRWNKKTNTQILLQLWYCINECKVARTLRSQKGVSQNFRLLRKMIYGNYWVRLSLILFWYFFVIMLYIVWNLPFKKILIQISRET